MEYRTLGRTGLEVSEVGFGAGSRSHSPPWGAQLLPLTVVREDAYADERK
jgi:aryl-alcohol dehydrogenase-like predicted oxidoreductase